MKICSRCVMDTTDPKITFDNEGYCNHCTNAIKTLNSFPFILDEDEKNKVLNEEIIKIKKLGQNKKYDCIIGVSGGVDSSYVAYFTQKIFF